MSQTLEKSEQTQIFDKFKVIDVDCHITEPHDIWTARTPKSRHHEVPQLIRNEDGKDVWMVEDIRLSSPSFVSVAGFDGILPEAPLNMDEIPAAMYDANERLKHMDDESIYAEVLYPNVGGFGNGFFMQKVRPELRNELVSIYNDWLTDWTSTDPDRLIAVSSVPFWDVDYAVKEVKRCAELGHKSINFCNEPESYDLPSISSTHWDPLWAVAEEAGLPVAFHIGGGDIGGQITDTKGMGWRTNMAMITSAMFMDNFRCISDLIYGGVCHKFPNLNFVSVESGVGWIPSGLEMMDWQWENAGVTSEHPEYDLLPSEYFRRQIYGSFWFEGEAARFAIEQYPDNILYETDYPHPTCQHPGPQTIARHPREYAEWALADLPEDLQGKVLHDTAARIYSLS